MLCMTAVIVAFCGKALHTHSDAYWNSLLQTETSSADGVSLTDNCPICHYSLSFFDDIHAFAVQTAAMFFVCVFLASVQLRAFRRIELPTLRGSPATL